VIVFVRVILAELPETFSGYVPTVTVDCVVTVKTVLVVGVTGFAPNSAFAPDGKPITFKVTGNVNPFVAVSCVV